MKNPVFESTVSVNLQSFFPNSEENPFFLIPQLANLNLQILKNRAPLMPQRKLLVFSLLLFLSLKPTTTSSYRIEFPSFSLRNFTLLGDSHLRNDGVVGLTRELGVPSSSAGTVIFNDPIRLRDPVWNTTASFSTRFSFSIVNANPTSPGGDGLTFFLSPDNRILGSPGGFLGLVNASQLTKNRFVAVEFDTRMDLHFNDPNGNHLGIDIDSLNSITTVDPKIDLRAGIVTTAWIDYDNGQENLRVYLSYSTLKPENPILTSDLSLYPYLREEMFVGFSGSTEGSTELHLIQDWSFETRGLDPRTRPPQRVPHNVSDASVNVTPMIPKKGTRKSTRKKLALGLGIAGPGLCFIALAIFVYLFVRRYKRFETLKGFGKESFSSPREFTFKELHAATRGFHPGRVVGRGAFGTVYRAHIPSTGQVAAIKRSKHNTHEGKSEFLSELSIIAGLRHKNLVRLQGWCVERGELLLVYDFMPNGSLDKALYGAGGPVLSWRQRLNVVTGLASALTYLHRECEQKVIHRDVKTANVLLDLNFEPKLGDFGLAKLIDHDNKSPVSTLTAGTMGYLAPEYLQYGKATEKTDVFSFGVVILEVACGSRPIMEGKKELGQKATTVNLVDWVWDLHSKGKIIEAIDKRLVGGDVCCDDFEEEMRRVLWVGLGCANPDSEARPTMRRALQMLVGEAEVGPVPLRKPSLTFSCSLSLKDIVDDDDDIQEEEDESSVIKVVTSSTS